jgi:ankyrin repeat protein
MLRTQSDSSKVPCDASLLHRRAKVNEKGETRLHVAARLNKLQDVVKLIADGADINAQDYAG